MLVIPQRISVSLGDETFEPFDPGSAPFNARFEFDRERLTDLVELVHEKVGNGRVLDLGAPPYIVTAALAATGYDITANGLPIRGCATNGLLKLTVRETERQVALALFDVEDPFPLADGAFDCVIAGEIFEHLHRQPWVLLAESWRVLRPGGLLVITTPNGHALTVLYKWLRRQETGMGFNPDAPTVRHAREYSVAEVDAVIKSQGFEIETVLTRNYSHIGPDGFPGVLGPAKRAIHSGLLRRAEGTTGPLHDRGQIIIAVARRTDRPPDCPPEFMFYGIGDDRTGYNFPAEANNG